MAAVLLEEDPAPVRLDAGEMVRARPDRFLGSVADGTALHRMVFELVNNAVAEALRGHGDVVKVTIDDDLMATVEDQGRGLPLDEVENQLTTFSGFTALASTRPARSHWLNPFIGRYSIAGLAAVNFLARRLLVEVRRDGHLWRQVYDDGRPRAPLQRAERAEGSGTRITVEADPNLFGMSRARVFDLERIEARLDDLAMLVPGVRFVLADRRTKKQKELVAPHGTRDRLARLAPDPVYDAVFHLEHVEDPAAGFQVALAWTRTPGFLVHSFVNGRRTKDDGTHVDGLRSGIDRALSEWPTRGGRKLGLRAVLAVSLDKATYAGAAGGRLTSNRAAEMVESTVAAQLSSWLRLRRELLFELQG